MIEHKITIHLKPEDAQQLIDLIQREAKNSHLDCWQEMASHIEETIKSNRKRATLAKDITRCGIDPYPATFPM